MNKNIREIISKTISELITEKERLNEDIEDIIYGDMGYVLKGKDFDEINKIREEINYIYELIGKLNMEYDKEIR